ncbi:hypothetical protein CEXT_96051 [Caerostris extrusa]|uniref:Uncharacterized protein n=1 Tax=Caerostris extrusa TaxID=172846 RepID=A0AAV4W2G0_CAEEX|nr:hypothetical protein CEXT_96051 [Caerostris extrusa]
MSVRHVDVPLQMVAIMTRTLLTKDSCSNKFLPANNSYSHIAVPANDSCSNNILLANDFRSPNVLPGNDFVLFDMMMVLKEIARCLAGTKWREKVTWKNEMITVAVNEFVN